MAITKITYSNKVGVVPKTVHINQVWDDDMNEIKKAVNDNADQLILNTSNINNILANPTSAQLTSAIPHLQYLIGNNVQLQLDQTETSIINLYKVDKNDSKNLYQTGKRRVDNDNSVLSIVETGTTLRITNVNDIMFVNEILIDNDGNKVSDFVKNFGTVDFLFNATNSPLTTGTRGIFYVGVNKLGTPVYRGSKIYDQDTCYLARLIIENVAGAYNIVSFRYIPDLITNKYNDRDRIIYSSGYIVPSGAASISFGNRACSYTKNSINYTNNKLDPNYLSISDSVNPTPMQFLFALPNLTSLATSLAMSTTINPMQWYTSAGVVGGTSISNTNYQVFKLLLSVTGTIIIQTKASTSNAPQPGVNAIFASRDAAIEGLVSTIFPDILPAGDSVGLGTFYLRAGTAANGSGMLDQNDFYFRPYTSSSSSSIVGVSVHDLLSGKNDNPAFLHVTSTQVSEWNSAYADRLKWDGSAVGLVSATGRASLGANAIGSNIFTSINPSAVTFLRANADNTVDFLNAANFRAAIGAGTGTISGSGTNGFIPLWNSAGNLIDSSWREGEDDMTADKYVFFNEGFTSTSNSSVMANFGVGTQTPQRKLTVMGPGAGTSIGVYSDAGAGDVDNRNWCIATAFDGYGDFAIRQSNAKDGDPYVAGTTRLHINRLGSVGIGNTNPSALLATGVAIAQADRATFGGSIVAGSTGTVYMNSAEQVGGLELPGNSTYGTKLYHNNTTDSFIIATRASSLTWTNRFTVSSLNGNVGIGTTSPVSNLHIVGDNKATGNFSNLVIGTNNSQGTNVGGSISLGGYYNATQSTHFGVIRGAKANPTSGNYDGYLAFEVAQNGVGAVERMRINSTGNVGIGTSGNGWKLNVQGYNAGTNAGTISLMTPAQASSERSSLTFFGTFVSNPDTGGRRVADILGGFASGAWGSEYMSFNVGTGGSNDAADLTNERMRILGNGNVGIGTTNPVDKLTLADGNLFVTTGYGQGIKFEDGFAIYRQAGYTQFQYANVERMRLSSSGVGVTGDLTVSALAGTGVRGVGVDATGKLVIGDGSTSGSTTPTSSNATNCTVASVSAVYTKIGNIVTVNMSFGLNVASGSFDTTFDLTLPFSTSATTPSIGSGTTTNSVGTAYIPVWGFLQSTTTVRIRFTSNGTGAHNGSIILQYSTI